MPCRIQRMTLMLAWISCFAVIQCMHAEGQERSGKDFADELIATLRIASDAEVAAARVAAIEQLSVVQSACSKQALGAVLQRELQLVGLASELQKSQPDPAVLHMIRQLLRKPLTGQIHESVNELRERIHRLSVLVSLTPDRRDDAVKAIELLTAHIDTQTPINGHVPESEFRSAFVRLAELHPTPSAVKSLRNRLSAPNHQVRVKRDFAIGISRRSFDLPVAFHVNANETDVTGNGQMHISISAEFPPSAGQSLIRITVTGSGQVGIAATREIARLQAATAAQISGTQLVSIKPKGMTSEFPSLQARFSTQLCGICLDGLLGRCILARRIAARVAQNALSQNDVSAARQFEQTARQRIQEEGFDIAEKINGLIENAFWDYLQAFDVNPEVQIRNDQTGIVSAAMYARTDQLGALTPAPLIPPEIDRHLDLTTWVHESMINNASDHLSGLQVDEVKIRELWEEEFKLTSPEWRIRPVGHIPVRMTLGSQNPVRLRFAEGGIEILLRTDSCEVDGTVRDTAAREFRIHYKLGKDETGTHFTREEAISTSPLPPELALIWQQVLDRFFGQSIRPMARFCNRDVPQLMQLEYLNLERGWLVIGAARTPLSSITPQNPSNDQRR